MLEPADQHRAEAEAEPVEAEDDDVAAKEQRPDQQRRQRRRTNPPTPAATRAASETHTLNIIGSSFRLYSVPHQRYGSS